MVCGGAPSACSLVYFPPFSLDHILPGPFSHQTPLRLSTISINITSDVSPSAWLGEGVLPGGANSSVCSTWLLALDVPHPRHNRPDVPHFMFHMLGGALICTGGDAAGRVGWVGVGVGVGGWVGVISVLEHQDRLRIIQENR